MNPSVHLPPSTRLSNSHQTSPLPSPATPISHSPSKINKIATKKTKAKKSKPVRPRPICNTCGRSFSKPANLRAHERIHTGEKRYECFICFRRFVWKSSLNFHHRSSHNNDIKKTSNIITEKQPVSPTSITSVDRTSSTRRSVQNSSQIKKTNVNLDFSVQGQIQTLHSKQPTSSTKPTRVSPACRELNIPKTVRSVTVQDQMIKKTVAAITSNPDTLIPKHTEVNLNLNSLGNVTPQWCSSRSLYTPCHQIDEERNSQLLKNLRDFEENTEMNTEKVDEGMRLTNPGDSVSNSEILVDENTNLSESFQPKQSVHLDSMPISGEEIQVGGIQNFIVNASSVFYNSTDCQQQTHQLPASPIAESTNLNESNNPKQEHHLELIPTSDEEIQMGGIVNVTSIFYNSADCQQQTHQFSATPGVVLQTSNDTDLQNYSPVQDKEDLKSEDYLLSITEPWGDESFLSSEDLDLNVTLPDFKPIPGEAYQEMYSNLTDESLRDPTRNDYVLEDAPLHDRLQEFC